mmetsp:Transcript_70567/g.188337  ORF Transcript_70567/g.188337 Transcript_70567/m.188337 type:complete len:208 (+) Transcript_70567:573-1196(+)
MVRRLSTEHPIFRRDETRFTASSRSAQIAISQRCKISICSSSKALSAASAAILATRASSSRCFLKASCSASRCSASMRSASRRSAWIRSASIRSASIRSASIRSDSIRSASIRSASRRSASICSASKRAARWLLIFSSSSALADPTSKSSLASTTTTEPDDFGLLTHSPVTTSFIFRTAWASDDARESASASSASEFIEMTSPSGST